MGTISPRGSRPGQRPETCDRSRSGRGGGTVELGGRGAGSGGAGAPPLPLPGVAMESWIVWLVLAAVLGVAEIMTTTLAFGLIAVGAVVGGGVGGGGGGGPFQLVGFGVASAAGLGVVRPIAVRHIKQPPLLRTGTSALVGRSAKVVEEVNDDGGKGRIGGGRWEAAP